MRITRTSFYLLALLFVISCQTQQDGVLQEPALDQAPYETSEEELDEVETERKLIKEGNLSFETYDLAQSRKDILAAVQEQGGYISSDQSYTSLDRQSQTLIIRIPAEKFDLLLEEITSGIDQLDEKRIEVKDVTEEYLDIEARLTTKKSLETRYRALLNRANSVSEVLEIEKQIGELRADIESIEGKLRYLSNRVSFSTLSVNFYKKSPKATNFGHKFYQGLQNGWENLMWFFIGIVNIWPFIFLFIGAMWAFRRWRSRK